MKKVTIFLVLSAIFTSWVFAANWGLPRDHLLDVTNGSVRGISTTSESGGFAKTWYNDKGFWLHAWFHDIADPIGDDFYEGWLVQQSPFKFISTGELELKEDGYYHNIFSSDIDYSSYDFYVLTLEPNDGNPDPAAHIFEWDVVSVDMEDKNKMIQTQGETMMQDSMIKNDKMMQWGVMKNLTQKQKELKEWIKQRLLKVDRSKLNPEIISVKIQMVRNTIDERGFSDIKKTRYLELLDIIEVAIWEVSMMSDS